MITFEIINDKYEVISTGLTKDMVLYVFVTKQINKNGRFFIRDSEGLDMKFNEFMEFY